VFGRDRIRVRIIATAIALAFFAALWLAPVAAADPPDKTPPVVTVPADMTVQATGPGGSAVTYSASAVDDVDGPLPVDCGSWPSGSTFPFGATTVTCSATDLSGNTGSASFTVTVVDTTPPVVTVPSDMTGEATGPGGAVVTYSASAVDLVDGTLTPTCGPLPSGSTFPFGATTVTCSATDTRGNTGSASFTVTVVDTTPPVVTVPSDRTVQATGPGGAVVTYSASAVDLVDGTLTPTCGSLSSGKTFPLGATTVTCSAIDTRNNTGTASFTVTVVDTAAPTLDPPDSITVTATGPNGVPATNPVVARFLDGARASDLVGFVKVSSNAPSIFPIGTTTVTFRATDSFGNVSSATSTVTVTAAPAVAPKAVDTTPPDDVTALTAALGSRSVILRWQSPKAADFDHVEVLRALDKGPSARIVVYSGSADLFRDIALRNGVAYRYVIVAVDRVGNRSAGIAVVVMPGAPQLVRPADGSLVKTLPTLLWVPARNATYYNVQLFRGSVKILSVWPGKNSFTLGRRWTYRGKTVTLRPGVYHWFVWPGLGKQAARRYGKLLGGATFTVKA
jgi:hypothetical protein